MPESLFYKVGLRPATFFKKKLWHRCFPVNFAKFRRTPFLTVYLRWLLLLFQILLVIHKLVTKSHKEILRIKYKILLFIYNFVTEVHKEFKPSEPV